MFLGELESTFFFFFFLPSRSCHSLAQPGDRRAGIGSAASE